MKITIITLFPKMITPFFDDSIIKRSQQKGKVEIEIINLRDFAVDDHGTVDDRPYGGGAGMVIRADVVSSAIQKAKSANKKSSKVFLTSAKGKTFNQKKATELSKLENIIIVAGHYEGFDERVMPDIDEEISLGDFIMTGGEAVAVAVVDSIIRLIPGVLKKAEATEEESFFELSVDDLIEICGEDEKLGFLKKNHISSVKLLEYPHYTRPESFRGKKVPEVLTNGNHAEIKKWRIREAYKQTVLKRPDLLG